MFASLLYLVSLTAVGQCGSTIQAQISSSASEQGVPVVKDFTSFSIEYSNLPFYAGVPFSN